MVMMAPTILGALLRYKKVAQKSACCWIFYTQNYGGKRNQYIIAR